MEENITEYDNVTVNVTVNMTESERMNPLEYNILLDLRDNDRNHTLELELSQILNSHRFSTI